MENMKWGQQSRPILLKNCRVIDPSQSMDQLADVFIAEGKIAHVGVDLEAKGAEIVDCRGLWVAPGLVDVHCHLREPGYEKKETILTGTRAAAHGGFTTLVAMANVNPAPDNIDAYRRIQEKICETAVVRVFQAASVTENLKGQKLTDMASLAAEGAKVFSDDGYYIDKAAILYKALNLAQKLNVIVSLHEEDVSLKAYMPTAYHPLNESAAIVRDLEVLRYSGGKMHLQHISTARSVELVRAAKAEGLKVTAEVCPHHLMLTSDEVPWKGTYAKMAPPLREQQDVDALIAGLDDGTVDFIATDHAPHTASDKQNAFDLAANGIIGLETALPLMMTKLVHERGYSPSWLIERMSTKPAKIFGLNGGTLAEGASADICIINPEYAWEIAEKDFLSKSNNSPFIGTRVKGRVVGTLVGGHLVYDVHTVKS